MNELNHIPLMIYSSLFGQTFFMHGGTNPKFNSLAFALWFSYSQEIKI